MPRTTRALILATVVGLPACRPRRAPSPRPSVSRAVVPLALPTAPEARCDVPLASASEGGALGGPLVRADEGLLYAAVDADADAVALLSRVGTTLSVERHLAVGRGPSQALFSRGALWVLERDDATLSAYDPLTGRRLCRRSIARDPVTLARSADGATLYVASTTPPRLYGLEARTLAPRFEVRVPREPRGLWVSPRGDRVVISHLAGAPLSVVDLRGATATSRRLPPPRFDERNRYVGGESMVSFRFTPAPSQAWSITLEPASGRLLVPMMANNHHVLTNGSGGGYGGGGGTEGLDEQTRFTVGVFDPGAEAWENVTYTSPRLLPGDAYEHDARAPVASAWSPREGLIVVAQGNDALAAVRPGRPPRWTENPPAPQRPTLTAADGVLVETNGEVMVHSLVEHAVEYGPSNARVRLAFGQERLDPLLARGRRLFLVASTRSAGDRVPCNGCHPDGRDDGLSWDFRQSGLRTPTLAGRTIAPFGWEVHQATADEAVREAVLRLRGTGLADESVTALAAWVTRGLRAPLPTAASPTAAAERGRALFLGGAECARCHSHDRGFVDGVSHAFDADSRSFDTPSLTTVSAGGPWFHDGRYATLEALLADPRSAMGRAHTLSASERDDLLAWLETL